MYNIVELNLPETLERIGFEAFSWCSQLPRLVIPNSVTYIGPYAFEGTESLQYLEIGESVESVGHWVFSNAPMAVANIKGVKPFDADDIENVIPANTLVAVPEGSVDLYKEAWPSLKIVAYQPADGVSLNESDITLNPGETYKLTYAVDPADAPIAFGCSHGGVTISNDGVLTVSQMVENFSTTVEVLTLNGLTARCNLRVNSLEGFSVDNLDYKILPGEENEVVLTSYCDYSDIPSNLTIPETVDYNGNTYIVAYIKEGIFNWIDQLEELTIPRTVKSLGYSSFQECNNLTKVTIADSNETLEVGSDMFHGCDKLATFYLGRNISGDQLTVNGCGLNLVILGSEVTEVSNGAFTGWGNNISVVEAKNMVPPTLSDNCFGNRYRIRVIVPEGAVDAYQEAWGDYGFASIGVAKDVTELAFAEDEVTIYGGEFIKLPLIVDPEDATIIWTTSDSYLVRVDAEGNIWITDWDREGEAVITATSLNGLTAECRVIVKKWFSFPKNPVSLTLGETTQLEIEKSERLASLDNVTVTWGIQNGAECISLNSETGEVTANDYGKARVYAEVNIVEMGISVTSYLDVNVALSPMSVSPESQEITLYQGNSAYIDLTFEPNEDYVDKTIIWTVENPEIAEVYQNWEGRYYVNALKAGNTTITGETLNGLKVEVNVKVLGRIDNLFFNTQRIIVAPEGTFQLEYTTEPEETGQTIRFESGNEQVATVDPETGLVTGVNFGYTDIYAIAENGWSWSVPVQVCIIPESVKFVGSTDYVGTLNYWTGFNLEFTPDDENVCRHIDWTAEDPEIVDIDSSDNTFIGRHFGTTNFKGVAVNGDVLEGTITIEGIAFAENGEPTTWKEVETGTEFKPEVIASSEDLLNNITFTSDDSEVVTISEDGTVKAVGVGRTSVRANTWIEVNDNEQRSYSTYLNIIVNPSEGICFNKQNVTLNPGNTQRLSILRAGNVNWSNLTWESSDEKVVRIIWSDSSEAQLEYVGPGVATVTATDEYGNVATCEVTCYGNIDNVKFNTEKIIVSREGTFQLEFTTEPETEQTYRFESEDENIATVDPETGVVTGIEYGNTYIVLIFESGSKWYVPVQVCEMPESVKFVGNTDYEGSMYYWTAFNIEFTPDNEYVCRDITWTVENPEIAYIDSYNNFIGQKVGTTAFKGVAANGDVLEGTITIPGIKILVDGEETNSIDVTFGEELKLDVDATSEDLLKNLSFYSYDTNVVTVSEDGVVTAVGSGRTNVEVQTWVEGSDGVYNNYYSSIEITVKPAAGIAFNTNRVVLTSTNQWGYLSIVRADDEEAGDITWESSDENVVAITWGDRLKAELRYQGPGNATITATDENGNVATCEVVCYQFEITPSVVYMLTNSERQLEVKILPDPTEEPSIRWSNYDGFVSVDEKGLLKTSDMTGNTRVYAETWIGSDNIWTYCDVIVSEFVPVTEITLNETSISAEEGTEVQLIATVNPENATNPELRWESSDEEVATVDENGLVKILSVGNAVITVWATDGSDVFATCTIYGTSGVGTILSDGANFDIYNMNGILVKKDATAEDYKQLVPGIYLIKKGNTVIKVKH